MKKLYKKGQVHPSPSSIADHLALLPATILTLTAALSAEDKEVLAYLIISCSNTCTNFSSHTKTILSSNGDGDAGDHTPLFECNCFRCYMSFWARWDASPSRELIHEIIEAYEEELVKKQERSTKSKKERRKRACNELKDGERDSGEGLLNNEFGQSVSVHVSRGDVDEFVMEKGSVRKIMSFIGERIWGVWNRV